MNFPLVSIVIPVYNGSNYLKEAIESALAQTYQNREIIVVNDGSNDDGATEAIALFYGDKIRYFKKTNGGVASALNLGISKMHGEFFSWLSHDDLYRPEKIEKQLLESFKHDPKTMIWSDYDVVDENGTLIGSFTLYDENKKSDAFILFSTYIHGCSLLIPTILFEEIGTFNESLRTTQDYEMWMRALKADYKFMHLNQKLISSRKHSQQGQVAMSDINKKETKKLFEWAVDYLGEDIGLNSKELKILFLRKGIVPIPHSVRR